VSPDAAVAPQRPCGAAAPLVQTADLWLQSVSTGTEMEAGRKQMTQQAASSTSSQAVSADFEPSRRRGPRYFSL